MSITASVLTGVVGMNASYGVPVPSGALSVSAGVESRLRLAGSYGQLIGYADLVDGQIYTVSGEASVDNQLSAHLGLGALVGGTKLDLDYWFSAGSGGLRMHAITVGAAVGF